MLTLGGGGVKYGMITYLGDIHGDLKIVKRLADNLDPGDTIIQVGDFGIGFLHEDKLKSLGRHLERCKVKCFAVRGNHDEPTSFKRHLKWGNLQLVPDNLVVAIEGKLHYFYGGAISVDRAFRTEQWDWWQKEGACDFLALNWDSPAFIYNEDFHLCGKLSNDVSCNINKIDVVVTHACPLDVVPVEPPHAQNPFLLPYFKRDKNLLGDLLKEGREMEYFRENLLSKFSIDKWYYGHYHVSDSRKKDGIDYRCLNINEVFYERSYFTGAD